MAKVILTADGQEFDIEDEIAADDELLKSVLKSSYPQLGDPELKRETKGGVVTVRILKINSTRTRDGFRAWLADDERVNAMSRQSALLAAENLAVMIFTGRNVIAQITEEELSKIVVRPVDGGGFRATYDG